MQTVLFHNMIRQINKDFSFSVACNKIGVCEELSLKCYIHAPTTTQMKSTKCAQKEKKKNSATRCLGVGVVPSARYYSVETKENLSLRARRGLRRQLQITAGDKGRHVPSNILIKQFPGNESLQSKHLNTNSSVLFQNTGGCSFFPKTSPKFYFSITNTS